MKRYIIIVGLSILIGVTQSQCMLPKFLRSSKTIRGVSILGASVATWLGARKINQNRKYEKTEVSLDDFRNIKTTVGDKKLSFEEILTLPQKEKTDAILEIIAAPKEGDDERLNNNRRLAGMVDFMGSSTGPTAQDFIDQVKQFESEDKAFDINAVAGLNSTGFYKKSLLHKAADSGNSTLIKFLVERGAPVNVLDGQDWTPLHTAIHRERVKAVQTLLDLGADATIKDTTGRTPVDLSNIRANDTPWYKKTEQIQKILKRLPNKTNL